MTKACILVAEDEHVTRLSLVAGLRNQGYEVVEAANGDEAIQRCSAAVPDIAILDIRMPAMSGLEVARIISRDFGVPYLFLSAVDDTETVQQAAAGGALGYLVKPINLNQVLAMVESALQRAGEIRGLRQTTEQLDQALRGTRAINTALGMLMERWGVDEAVAFDTVRNFARRHRLKLTDLAVGIVQREVEVPWPAVED